MSIQILIGILVNTALFGLMGWSNNKLGLGVPRILSHGIFNTALAPLYFMSFGIILFSPESLFMKIVVAILLQFLINHLLWGVIIGVIARMHNKSI